MNVEQSAELTKIKKLIVNIIIVGAYFARPLHARLFLVLVLRMRYNYVRESSEREDW